MTTDMTMPGVSGDRFTQMILAVRQETPVIICSRYSEKMNAVRTGAIGARHFAQKPLDANAIAAIIRDVLDCGSSRVPPTASYQQRH